MEIGIAKSLKRFFIKEDLKKHCLVNDGWVTIQGDVIDVTSVIKSNRSKKGVENIIKYLGNDMSHLFKGASKDPYIRNPILSEELANNDKNYILHFPVHYINDKSTLDVTPWYKDRSLIIGKMSKKEIKILITNILTYQEEYLVVPVEETLDEICNRYLDCNFHARSYTWKDINENVLNMNLTLIENNLISDLEALEYMEIPDEFKPVPAIYLFFNDDLTEI